MVKSKAATTKTGKGKGVVENAKGSSSGGKASEIDDIFGGSSSSKAVDAGRKAESVKSVKSSSSSSSSRSGASEAKPVKTKPPSADDGSRKDKKRKSTPPEASSSSTAKKPKRAIQIVTDTSSTLPSSTSAPPKRTKSTKSSSNPTTSIAADLDSFTDSRGTASRKRTTDGLRIYTEDELQLDKADQGVFTDLCPFDCDCCF